MSPSGILLRKNSARNVRNEFVFVVISFCRWWVLSRSFISRWKATPVLKCITNVSLATFIPYIFSLSLKFEACYIMGQWGEFRIKNANYVYIIIFHQKNCFYYFHFYFNETSNFGNRILANQKQELIIKNSQWNSISF